MRARRQTTITPRRHAARDAASNVPKSIELELRVARMELAVSDIREVLDVLMKQCVALQAQLDHVAARINR